MPHTLVRGASALIVFTLILAGLTATRPAAAQGVPAGSYLQSCGNAQIVDGTLLADCRRANGTIRATTLPHAFRCHGDIGNRNGRLVCVVQQILVPAGSYLQSCSNAQIVDGTLVALCPRFDGSLHQTRLPYPLACHGDIGNADGHLRCFGG